MSTSRKEMNAEEIKRRAEQLLTEGRVGDAPLRDTALVLPAIAVSGPEHALHSWFLPIAIDASLAAFIQMLPDGTLMRFSSFQRRPGELTGCPSLADWIDPDQIRKRAAALGRSGEAVGAPFLTYDRNPDRLVWSIPLTGGDGSTRYVYVIGDSAYEPPPARMIG